MTDDLAAGTARKWLTISLVAVAALFGMSPWFSASAAGPALAARWQLSAVELPWLTMAVQFGFVVGALTSAVANLPDRFPPRVLLALGCGASAVFTALLPALDPDFRVALVLRALTGASCAFVYPVGMKIVASWTLADRGLGIAIVVFATTLGSAAPHLIRALGAHGDWRQILQAAAVLAGVGAVVAAAVGRLGPHAGRTAPFRWDQVGLALRRRPLRLANAGYLGHMWELYAMWTWAPAFLDEALVAAGWSRPAAALAGFATVGIGGVGSLVAGLLADRFGRTRVASLSLIVSGTCALLVGLAADVHALVLLAVCLVWGFAVVADSAQFSASISELADREFVGTQLTTQTAMGFLLTMASIQIVPLLRDALGWRWTFATLALGPVFGVRAMVALRALPEAARLAGGRR